MMMISLTWEYIYVYVYNLIVCQYSEHSFMNHVMREPCIDESRECFTTIISPRDNIFIIYMYTAYRYTLHIGHSQPFIMD